MSSAWRPSSSVSLYEESYSYEATNSSIELTWDVKRLLEFLATLDPPAGVTLKILCLKLAALLAKSGVWLHQERFLGILFG